MDIKTTSKNLFETSKSRIKELWDKEMEEDNVDLVIRRLNEGYYDQLPNGQERKHHAVCIVMDKLGTASLQLDVGKRYLKEVSDQGCHD